MDWAFDIINRLAEFPFSSAILISFLAGLGTSFNPCMLGMAASVLSFKNESNQQNQMAISLIFMLSFSITLTLLGFLSSFLGEQVLMWHETYGSSLYFLLAGVFIVLGCYILGLRMHHLLHPLPVRFILFYAKQGSNKGQTPVHPTLKASSLGFLFGLTPSPCTTPMILAMLAYTMMKGSVLLGSVLLFAYGIGHGMPFLLMVWMSGAMKRSRWMLRWHRLFYKFVGAFFILIGLFFLVYDNSPMPM